PAGIAYGAGDRLRAGQASAVVAPTTTASRRAAPGHAAAADQGVAVLGAGAPIGAAVGTSLDTGQVLGGSRQPGGDVAASEPGRVVEAETGTAGWFVRRGPQPVKGSVD